MTIVEMYDKVKEIYVANEDNYYYIGLRFENKERIIGEVIEEQSRHNSDREDERDFPDFGTEEYEEMDVLDGVSAWDLAVSKTYKIDKFDLKKAERGDDCSTHFLTNHCYIIASNKQGRHDDPDDGEIVIKDAVVIAQLF